MLIKKKKSGFLVQKDYIQKRLFQEMGKKLLKWGNGQWQEGGKL